MREGAYIGERVAVDGALPAPGKRAAAEGIGTAFLVAAVVGSGIMADRLSGGNTGLALLANSLATGAMLVALILTCGAVSGAHFNPVVSMASMWWGELASSTTLLYVVAQCIGAAAGVVSANLMFGEPAILWSRHARAGLPQVFSEVVATFGLVGTICGCARRRPDAVPFAVGAYIVAAYWFTVSTSFANPAVTIARAATDTFTGIRPQDAPLFIAAQLVGGGGAAVLFHWLVPRPTAARLG
jgi:glycerol uptake facilitator-like aquaporin